MPVGRYKALGTWSGASLGKTNVSGERFMDVNNRLVVTRSRWRREEVDRVKEVKYMVRERNLTMREEHTVYTYM